MKKFILTKLSYILYRILNSDIYKEKKKKLDIIYFQKKYKLQFKKLGNNVIFSNENLITNPQYITIGDNFYSKKNIRFEAIDKYGEQIFSPEINIGDNVIMQTDVHIGAIDRVSIGDRVLIASRVYISDHYHGSIDATDIKFPPAQRKLTSKGPVIIKDNVWIGEGVCILPGVTIGENSIIGANAVVNKNIPENSVAAGIPAKVIKSLQ